VKVPVTELMKCISSANQNDVKILNLLYGNVGVLNVFEDREEKVGRVVFRK
jgi:hypothetical protein